MQLATRRGLFSPSPAASASWRCEWSPLPWQGFLVSAHPPGTPSLATGGCRASPDGTVETRPAGGCLILTLAWSWDRTSAPSQQEVEDMRGTCPRPSFPGHPRSNQVPVSEKTWGP